MRSNKPSFHPIPCPSAARRIVVSETWLEVPRGESRTYGVALGAKALEWVTVDITSGSSSVTLNPASVLVNPNYYSDFVSVVVSVAAGVGVGSIVKLTHRTRSDDPLFDGLTKVVKIKAI